MSKDIYTIDYAQLGLLEMETKVLQQYQLLATQLKTLNTEICKLNSSTGDDTAVSAEEVLDNMRNLEKRLGIVYTFFQSALYQLYLQNEAYQNGT